MPNHCLNSIHLDSDEHFEEVRDYLNGEDQDGKEVAVDFNQLAPMPNELRGTTSPCEKNPVLEEKYGASNWYDWSIKNWGTKWNAYHIDTGEWNEEERTIHFDTAWGTPEPLLFLLSSKFPTVIFNHTADIEGCDEVYDRDFLNGEVTREDTHERDFESWEDQYDEPEPDLKHPSIK